MKTDVYIAFYDNRKRCGYVHKLVQLCTWSNVSHVALIFDLGFTKLTPMVLTNVQPKLFTEDSLNLKSKCLYKKYIGVCNMNIESIKSICDNHKKSTVLKEVFAFLIGRWIGIYPSNCCTLAVDFMNTRMNYNLKNRYNPNKLMKEICYDSSYDSWASKSR